MKKKVGKNKNTAKYFNILYAFSLVGILLAMFFITLLVSTETKFRVAEESRKISTHPLY
jgi:ABC-type sulfate transport system permease component